MMSLSWHTVNYYKLSLGIQDSLNTVIKDVLHHTKLNEESSKQEVEQTVIEEAKNNKTIKDVCLLLEKYVPYRFLSPFFAGELKGLADYKKNKEIMTLATNHFNTPNRHPLYRLDDKYVYIHPKWKNYLSVHLKLIEDFCFWNLVIYLQSRNPNVPNLGNKLFAPQQKRNLTPATKYWKFVHQQSPIRCIYSNKILSESDFSIDHFLPWSFVSHDAIWNLIPTSKSVNSSKSNCLPRIDEYLAPFALYHYQAFNLNFKAKKHAKILEDYVLAFKDNEQSIANYSPSEFVLRIEKQIKPLIQIAANLGFEEGWVYE